MKERRVRTYKLKLVPQNALAKDIFFVSEYSKLSGFSKEAIYARIDRVLDGTQKWTDWKAYRKDDNIVIMKIKTKNTATNENPKKQSSTNPEKGSTKHRRELA